MAKYSFSEIRRLFAGHYKRSRKRGQAVSWISTKNVCQRFYTGGVGTDCTTHLDMCLIYRARKNIRLSWILKTTLSNNSPYELPQEDSEKV